MKYLPKKAKENIIFTFAYSWYSLKCDPLVVFFCHFKILSKLRCSPKSSRFVDFKNGIKCFLTLNLSRDIKWPKYFPQKSEKCLFRSAEVVTFWVRFFAMAEVITVSEINFSKNSLTLYICPNFLSTYVTYTCEYYVWLLKNNFYFVNVSKILLVT